MTAADLLGSGHPLARATRRFETACLHLLSGLLVLAGFVCFARGPARSVEIVAAAAICLILAGLALSHGVAGAGARSR